MWRHTDCNGEVYPVNNGGGDWCSKCNQSELYGSDIYIDHYIINEDGQSLVSKEAT